MENGAIRRRTAAHGAHEAGQSEDMVAVQVRAEDPLDPGQAQRAAPHDLVLRALAAVEQPGDAVDRHRQRRMVARQRLCMRSSDPGPHRPRLHRTHTPAWRWTSPGTSPRSRSP